MSLVYWVQRAWDWLSGAEAEQERNRQATIRYRHNCYLRAEHKRRELLRIKDLKARKSAEYKAREFMLDHLTELQTDFKKQQSSIREEISRLSAEKDEMLIFYKVTKSRMSEDQKRQYQQAIDRLGESVDIFHGEIYRLYLLIKDFSNYKHLLTSVPLTRRPLRQIPKNIENIETFSGPDFPIRYHVVRAVVRSPKRGLRFSLDGEIMATLNDGEVPNTQVQYRSNQKVRVFIRSVSYKEGKAIISLLQATFVDALKKNHARSFPAVVTEIVSNGILVGVCGVRAFLPGSLMPAAMLTRIEVGKKLRVIVIDRDRSCGRVIVRPYVSNSRKPE